MVPYEKYMPEIGNAITIRDEDRPFFTKNFDIIRDYVLRIMCKYDANFKLIYKGPSLFGSYANSSRILKPSEFDVHIQLTFPFSKYINIEEDERRPGFIRLDFSDVLEEMDGVNGYKDFFEHLNTLVDFDYYYLRRPNLQRWIESVIDGALYKYGDRIKGIGGTSFKLIYSKRGLAHTIYAKDSNNENYNISIDLVPAIMFGQEDWMDIHEYNSSPFAYKCDRWYAVPKPSPGPKRTRKYAFMICNPKVEHHLLLNKYNLKVTFRLLKSMIKKYKLRRMKSYFITTAFLWEIEKQKNNTGFWMQPVSELFIHMLDVISDYFLDEYLPFFWDDELNLLDNLSEQEVENYAAVLCGLYNTFKQYPTEPKLSYERLESHFLMPKK